MPDTDHQRPQAGAQRYATKFQVFKRGRALMVEARDDKTMVLAMITAEDALSLALVLTYKARELIAAGKDW